VCVCVCVYRDVKNDIFQGTALNVDVVGFMVV
jgi:hypothetical protein